MNIRYIHPDDPEWSMAPGVYMSAETKYDLEKEGVLDSDWTYEPLAYKGLPVTPHEDVPLNTLWIVGDLRDAIVDALRKLPEDTTWGIPVRDGVSIVHDDAALLRLLDMACARALGTHIRPEDIEANNHRRVFPPYSSDPTVARVLEDEVKRSGLAHEYAAALYGIVTHHYLTHEGATPDEIVLLVFATPEQRARAFLEVTKKNA